MMRSSLLFTLLCVACSPAPAPPHAAAATVTAPIAESALATVHLSAEARTKLGIITGVVKRSDVVSTRIVGGEVVVPPGRTSIVTSPVAGLVRVVGTVSPGMAVTRGATLLQITALAPADRDTRARIARDVAAADATLAALQLRVDRNQILVDEKAGSARVLEEAVAARDVARADSETARARATTLAGDPLLADVALAVRAPVDGIVRAMQVADRQIVPAGTALFEVVAVDALQVRVPVYSGDLSVIDVAGSPVVRHLRHDDNGVVGAFAAGPPTAEPDRGTVDRWLTLPSTATFMPGERVLVTLPLKDTNAVATVDTAAVVVDALGGSWVYACSGDGFTRTRIDPVRRAGDRTVIARGPAIDSCIVVVGASEIFGSEFPPGH